MRTNRSGDPGVLAVVQCVIATHHSLKFGELADHAAGKIGFSQLCGPFRERWIGACVWRYGFG
jgi:hypothetical protein